MKWNGKPRVVISKCIEFDHCRYNGQTISSDVVEELQSFLDFIPVCPEVEIGLGIPRDPIRIVYKDSQTRLVQPSTAKDVTERMQTFSARFLSSLENIDGFILKNRSPSCGIKEVKVYPAAAKVAPIKSTAGFFGDDVLKRFSHLAIEDEGRLRNPDIREHFLRKIYALAQFRTVKQNQKMKELIKYHTRYKFMFMAYNQKKLQKLGQILGNHTKRENQNLYSEYESSLHDLLKRPPRCTQNINVLQHAFGYVSDQLSSDEKQLFSQSLEGYRNGNLALATVMQLMKAWIIRFDEEYLQNQSFFSPYPEELVHADNIETCSSRDYFK